MKPPLRSVKHHRASVEADLSDRQDIELADAIEAIRLALLAAAALPRPRRHE